MIGSDAVRVLPDAPKSPVSPVNSVPGAVSLAPTRETPVVAARRTQFQVVEAEVPLSVLIVVPTLEAGAADTAAIEHAAILRRAGHRPIVVSAGGRLEAMLADSGAEFVRLNVATRNPIAMARNAWKLARLARAHRCDVIHAHARGAAWSAYLAGRATGVPMLATWHKGFREQNALKRLYNSVMVRGDRVIAANERLAELVHNRYGTPWSRIRVVSGGIDLDRFDPGAVSGERIAAVRRSWGVRADAKVILVVGRKLRRKGHHVVVEAVRRLRDLGAADFVCVFVGEDQGRTRYVGELWDKILATDLADVIRLNGAVTDIPAAYAAATAVVSASIQPEGLQRAILEAQAMARPVVVSDLAADETTILAPPAVPAERMTGLRVPAGDQEALAQALIRLFSLAESELRAIGVRGRARVLDTVDAESLVQDTLALYAEAAGRRR